MCYPGAQQSVEGVVRLKMSESIDMSAITSAQDCIDAATNPDMLASIEELVAIWCKQIEQVDWLVYTCYFMTLIPASIFIFGNTFMFVLILLGNPAIWQPQVGCVPPLEWCFLNPEVELGMTKNYMSTCRHPVYK